MNSRKCSIANESLFMMILLIRILITQYLFIIYIILQIIIFLINISWPADMNNWLTKTSNDITHTFLLIFWWYCKLNFNVMNRSWIQNLLSKFSLYWFTFMYWFKLYPDYEVCVRKKYLNSFKKILKNECHRTFKIEKRENSLRNWKKFVLL